MEEDSWSETKRIWFVETVREDELNTIIRDFRGFLLSRESVYYRYSLRTIIDLFQGALNCATDGSPYRADIECLVRRLTTDRCLTRQEVRKAHKIAKNLILPFLILFRRCAYIKAQEAEDSVKIHFERLNSSADSPFDMLLVGPRALHLSETKLIARLPSAMEMELYRIYSYLTSPGVQEMFNEFLFEAGAASFSWNERRLEIKVTDWTQFWSACEQQWPFAFLVSLEDFRSVVINTK